MKITKVETLLLSRMHELHEQWVTSTLRIVKADCAVVVVHTDDGLTGIGEACAYGAGVDARMGRVVQSPHPRGPRPAQDCDSTPYQRALLGARMRGGGH